MLEIVGGSRRGPLLEASQPMKSKLDGFFDQHHANTI
jgi:hypothetical protein